MFSNSVSTVLVGCVGDFDGMSIAWMTQVEREHVLSQQRITFWGGTESTIGQTRYHIHYQRATANKQM